MEGDYNSAVDTVKQREVTKDDRNTLKEALHEVLANIKHEGLSLDQSSSHGSSTELIEDIAKHCQQIFTVEHLMANFPFFSTSNALSVLEIVQEVFIDIPNFEETSALHNFHSNFQKISSVNELFDFNRLELGIDSDGDHELSEL